MIDMNKPVIDVYLLKPSTQLVSNLFFVSDDSSAITRIVELLDTQIVMTSHELHIPVIIKEILERSEELRFLLKEPLFFTHRTAFQTNLDYIIPHEVFSSYQNRLCSGNGEIVQCEKETEIMKVLTSLLSLDYVFVNRGEAESKYNYQRK